MEKRIKLIWDFWGEDAEFTAKHHAVHLKEYAERENLKFKISGYNSPSKDQFIAYLVVTEAEMKPVRDALKPHRGEYFNEEQE